MRGFLCVLACVLFLTSCGSQGTGGQRAVIQMRDGTSVSGAVLASSASEIKVAGDDNITRTIPMSQVKSIDYGDAPPATAAVPPGTQPAPGSPPVTAADGSYHPPESAI